MHQLVEMILGYVRSAWRYRWLALLVAWAISLGGWVYVSQMPDEYRSSAQVHLDTDSILRPLLRGLTVDINVAQRVQLLTRTLLSQPNLEKLARATDLHLQAATPGDMDRLVDRLRARISIGSDRRQPNLFTIAYTDTDPRKAQEVVQALLNIFMESTLGESRQDTDLAQRFLDQQIREYEQRLVAAEERLADFRRANVGMMPSDRGNYYSRLEGVETQLESAQLQIREVQNRRSELARQLAREQPVIQGGENWWGVASPYDTRIQNMEAQIDELLLRFTERHPDVVALRRTIADLEERHRQDLELMEQSDSVSLAEHEATRTNPVFQSLRLALSAVDAEIASLRVRVRQFEDQTQDLLSRIDTIPQIEAELARLDRDYNVNRNQYNQLLQRRETAQMVQVVEERGEQVQFRVIEPPRVPRAAAGPNRPMHFTIVLVVALGAGAGLAFVLSQLRPVFDNRRALAAETGFPVLGSVSWAMSPLEKARIRLGLVSFAALAAALLLVFGGAVLFDAPLHQIVSRIT
jgi:polysaccharide chain length determinant protein (PEP-CTERM system associated)